jgi:ABC-type multidrug transport system permease subunit
MFIPKEFNIGGVYLPPILIAATLGAIIAWITVKLLNRYRLSEYLFYPPLVFVGLMVIYTVLLGVIIPY